MGSSLSGSELSTKWLAPGMMAGWALRISREISSDCSSGPKSWAPLAIRTGAVMDLSSSGEKPCHCILRTLANSVGQ